MARRNLRMHQRNHSWGGGGLQSLAHDQQPEDGEDLSKESCSSLASHPSPSSPPELHWFEADTAMGGIMNMREPATPKPDEILHHSIMMVCRNVCIWGGVGVLKKHSDVHREKVVVEDTGVGIQGVMLVRCLSC